MSRAKKIVLAAAWVLRAAFYVGAWSALAGAVLLGMTR